MNLLTHLKSKVNHIDHCYGISCSSCIFNDMYSSVSCGHAKFKKDNNINRTLRHYESFKISKK